MKRLLLLASCLLFFGFSFSPYGQGPATGGAGGAPVNAQYIVGAVNAVLTNEIVASADAQALLVVDFAAMRALLGVYSTVQADALFEGILINSAGLLAALNDETGTGLSVFNNTPTFITPILGVASATTLNTGQGDYELWAMNQDVEILDSPEWASIIHTDVNISPDTPGELLYDNVFTGVDDGGFTWYDDDEIRLLVDLDSSEVLEVGDDGHILTYIWNGGAGYFTLTAAGAGDVSAAAIITDHNLVRGDGGAKGVQETGITVDDTDNMSGVASLTVDPSANPTYGMYDVNGDGVDFADKYAGDINANMTDTTEDAEVSDVTINYQDAGAKTAAVIIDGSDNQFEFQIPTTLQPNDVISSEIDTIVESVIWNAAGMVPDGTECEISSTAVQINSGPLDYTAICTDADASSLYGHIVMPDSWDGGTVTFELEYLQTAADTDPLNSDIAAMCRGATEAVNNTWSAEAAIDDAAVTGSNAVDHTTSAAVTPNGTCAGGDTLYFRWQIDAGGTTTAVATLHFLGMKMEYTSTVGD